MPGSSPVAPFADSIMQGVGKAGIEGGMRNVRILNGQKDGRNAYILDQQKRAEGYEREGEGWILA